MSTITQMATMADIDAVARQIVERFNPQRIVLFGSYARGVPTPDSDIDLLVLLDTEAAPLHVAAEIAAAIDHPFPLDILVATPSSFDAALERNAIFMTEVKTNGVVLYEA